MYMLTGRCNAGLYEMGAHVTASNTPLGGDLKELQQCVERWQCEEREGKVPEGLCLLHSAAFAYNVSLRFRPEA